MEKESQKTRTKMPFEFIAYAGSISAALLTMWASIRKNFYNEMKELGAYDAIRDGEAGRIVKEKRLVQGKLAGESFSLLEKIKRERETYSTQVENVHKALGFTNSWKKFLYLPTSDQAKVITLGLTVSSVAIGAFLGLHFKRDILEKINKKERDTSASISQQR